MLTQDQVAQFKQLGFVTVPDLLTPRETTYFTRVFDETMQGLEESGYFDEEESSRTPRTKKGRQVAPLFDKDERFFELLDNPRLNDTVEELLGKDCVLVEPGVGSIFSIDTPWHCDLDELGGWTWLKCSLYLDEPGPDTGSLYLMPGSHRPGFGAPIQDAMNAGRLGGLAAADIPGAFPVRSKPGTAVIFNQATRHAHFGGKIPRRAILINYCQAPHDRRHEYLLAGRIKTFEKQWGERMFSQRLLETAGARRRKRIEKPMELYY